MYYINSSIGGCLGNQDLQGPIPRYADTNLIYTCNFLPTTPLSNYKESATSIAKYQHSIQYGISLANQNAARNTDTFKSKKKHQSYT